MVKAIDTVYNGRRYRSRIEARWSVVFDALDLPFEYEKEGYELQSGWYLPDFWLPTLDCWIEIKGKPPTEKEGQLAGELAVATQKKVYIFAGDIPSAEFGEGGNRYTPLQGPNSLASVHQLRPGIVDFGWDNCYQFCVCLDCGAIGIEYDGRSDRLPCKDTGCSRSLHGDKGYTSGTERIQSAYDKARQARFEKWERQ